VIQPADQEQHWIAHVGEIRGERLAGRSAALKFIGQYFANAPSEVLFVIYLDRGLRICDIASLGRGSIDGVQVRIADVIQQGTAVNAACFLLVHNQPRGDPTPSQLDLRITNRIRQVSEELDMPLLDHFIVAGSDITSVAGSLDRAQSGGSPSARR
jgi:DNA repair protein RadC